MLRAIRFYSPLVLNIASSEGISMSELENIEGTGQDGRVSKKDIVQYLEKGKTNPQGAVCNNRHRDQWFSEVLATTC